MIIVVRLLTLLCLSPVAGCGCEAICLEGLYTARGGWVGGGVVFRLVVMLHEVISSPLIVNKDTRASSMDCTIPDSVRWPLKFKLRGYLYDIRNILRVGVIVVITSHLRLICQVLSTVHQDCY